MLSTIQIYKLLEYKDCLFLFGPLISHNCFWHRIDISIYVLHINLLYHPHNNHCPKQQLLLFKLAVSVSSNFSDKLIRSTGQVFLQTKIKKKKKKVFLQTFHKRRGSLKSIFKGFCPRKAFYRK